MPGAAGGRRRKSDWYVHNRKGEFLNKPGLSEKPGGCRGPLAGCEGNQRYIGKSKYVCSFELAYVQYKKGEFFNEPGLAKNPGWCRRVALPTAGGEGNNASRD